MTTAAKNSIRKIRQKLFRQKAQARVHIARRPIAEKLATLDRMREMEQILKPIRARHLAGK